LKVTLIYPDLLLHRPDWRGYFYIGVASLSAVLKQEGHQTSLIHITRPISKFDFIDRVKKESPELVGFSSTSPMFPFVKKFASWLVEAEIEAPTICGGIHPTIAPEESIGVEGIEIICRGEGEAAMAELCRKIENNEEISNIPNLWTKKDGDIIKNPLRPILDDLDKLPFPDRSIFNYQNLYSEREGKGSFMVARGCPYNCTYCCNHLMRNIYESKDKSIRYRSVDNIIAEIKEVVEYYHFIKTVHFDDDILFLKKEWAEEFTEKYSREIKLPFVCNARANLVDKGVVELLKKAGCYHIKFGLESGNAYICNEILNRCLTNKQTKTAFALCREAGLITESFNMVGIPYETPSTILDTIKLNAAIAVDKMQVSIYQPYKGTRLANLCQDQGFSVSGDLESDWFSPSILKLDTISPSQVLMFRDYFKVLVRYYQVLQRLPAGISKFAIRLSDRIFSFVLVSNVLNSIYIPLNYLFRRMQILRVRTKVARRKSASRLRHMAIRKET
jgi:radical SAM superfamily enzyme YgiQ (UPF0313 family)